MIKKNIVPISILLIILIFFLYPQLVFTGGLKGVQLWYMKILPFLLPLFILSNILLQYDFLFYLIEGQNSVFKKFFSSSFAFIPLLVSIIAGYPSGAVVTDIMFKNRKICKEEAYYLILFTNNCSYQFISSVVAFTMLGNNSLAKYIALPNYFSAIIFGLFYMKNKFPSYDIKSNFNKSIPFSKIFQTSISKSLKSILTIGVIVMVFSIFSELLNYMLSTINFNFLNSSFYSVTTSFIIGMLEITNGCNLISSAEISISLKLLIINFLLSFSGLSIILQTISVTPNLSINIFSYIKSRLCLGILSATICLICLLLFPL